MHQETRTFPTSGPIIVKINDGAGSIRLSAARTDQAVVELSAVDNSEAAERVVVETTVEFADGVLRVAPPEQRFGSQPGVHMAITVPEQSSAQINSGSAPVTCGGELSSLTVNTGSGDVTADTVTGDTTIKSGSGAINAVALGTAQLNSASGAIRVERMLSGDLNTASGEISVQQANGQLNANTASGRIDIASLAGDANLRGVSGEIRIGLVAGLAARLDVTSLTGNVSSSLPVSSEQPTTGAPVDIAAHTVSGSISIYRAASVPTS
jgi:DUF4097 and DUF4098 domain-containing protein YvlB